MVPRDFVDIIEPGLQIRAMDMTAVVCTGHSGQSVRRRNFVTAISVMTRRVRATLVWDVSVILCKPI